MVHSKYYNELKDYLVKYHPDMAMDDDFISLRSELAQETLLRKNMPVIRLTSLPMQRKGHWMRISLTCYRTSSFSLAS